MVAKGQGRTVDIIKIVYQKNILIMNIISYVWGIAICLLYVLT